MATLILSAVGNALLPGVGGYIGAAVGAYIDQTLLFPPPDIKGPRLDSISLQSASEGSPLSFCLGDENRTAGNIIWTSKVRARKKKSGGKGGPTQTTDTYSIDIAIAASEALSEGIEEISEIWANGLLLYNAHPDITYTSTGIVATVETYVTIDNTQIPVTHYLLVLTSPSLGPDLSKFHSGVNVLVSGYSTVALNGTRRCVYSDIDTLTGISVIKLRADATISSDTGTESVTLFQDLPEFSKKDATAFTFYDGSEDQLPDPLIESYLGTGNVPAYRQTAYVVIQGLQLESFGNSVPQMQFKVVQASGTLTNAAAINVLMSRSDLTSESWDTARVTGNLRGIVIRGPQTIVDQLRPIVTAFDIMTQEDGEQIKFFMRSSPDLVVAASADLAAREEGQEVERPAKIEDVSTAKLPSRLEVSYVDPDHDYQTGSHIDRRNQVTVDNLSTVDFDQLVLAGSEARSIARRLLWEAIANSRKISTTLPPSYMLTAEGDNLLLPVNGENHTALILKVEVGANGIVTIDGVREEPQTLVVTNVPSDLPRAESREMTIPPEMFDVYLDLAPMRDEDVFVAGFYLGSCCSNPNATYQGASLVKSIDGGATYNPLKDLPNESTIGRMTTTLATAVTAYWDEVNTFTVELLDGELEAHTELEVLGGINWCVIGLEVVGFRTPTLVGTRRYQCSGLLRGLRNTEEHVGTHVAGEIFTLLDDTAITFISVPQSSINTNHIYKDVPVGGEVADYQETTLPIVAMNLKPFAPVQLYGARDGALDTTITWVRRTRALTRVFGGVPVPLAEEVEEYEIDIYDGAGYATVMRTIAVIGATSTVYTAAMQVTDVGSSGVTIYGKIYMISGIVGRGKPTTFAI